MKEITLTIGGPEITTRTHPVAQELEKILKSIARTYNCSLLDFKVDHGKARFLFNSPELTSDIFQDFAAII